MQIIFTVGFDDFNVVSNLEKKLEHLVVSCYGALPFEIVYKVTPAVMGKKDPYFDIVKTSMFEASVCLFDDEQEREEFIKSEKQLYNK